MADPAPVTGAWHPGDEPGHRRFITFATDHPFALDGGLVMRDVTVAYETWGTLDATASNALVAGSLRPHPAPRSGTATAPWGVHPGCRARRPLVMQAGSYQSAPMTGWEWILCWSKPASYGRKPLGSG